MSDIYINLNINLINVINQNFKCYLQLVSKRSNFFELFFIILNYKIIYFINN